MEHLDQDATTICAHLLRQGFIPKNRVPNLELDEQLFREVQDYLTQVGMELVHNSYSDYYAVRLSQNIQDDIDQSNNLGLKNNEIAMLVILWCKLILPQRLEMEASLERESQAKLAMLNQQNAAKETTLANNQEPIVDEILASTPLDIAGTDETISKATKEKNGIRVGELLAEFGNHFGSKSSFKSALTRLSNLQFIKIHDEIISEGIFLDLLIDGYQMGNEIKKSALAYKLAGLSEEDFVEDEDEEMLGGDVSETEE